MTNNMRAKKINLFLPRFRIARNKQRKKSLHPNLSKRASIKFRNKLEDGDIQSLLHNHLQSLRLKLRKINQK